MSRIDLCGLTLEEINNAVLKYGGTRIHSLKISNSLYKKGSRSFSEIRDIPKKLIDSLTDHYSAGVIAPVRSETSVDGTVKYLFINDRGLKFETVYIPDKDRHTVCVSSQSGCRMGCPFCATARYGFHGNLTPGDIVSQVTGNPCADMITHVVFMGMGEPMDNLDNVLKAAGILTAEWGRSLSSRNITVSTVGITPAIRRFLVESEFNLAVSLFSPFFEERKRVVPVENRYPVEEIIHLLRSVSLKKGRRLTFSYVMIRDVNDTDDHLEELHRLFAGSGIRINLLPYHRLRNDEKVTSPAERMMYFKHRLVTSGVPASVRRSRGADISAACGLLAEEL